MQDACEHHFLFVYSWVFAPYVSQLPQLRIGKLMKNEVNEKKRKKKKGYDMKLRAQTFWFVISSPYQS